MNLYAIQQSAFIGFFSVLSFFALLCFTPPEGMGKMCGKLKETKNWALTQKLNSSENFNLSLAIFPHSQFHSLSLRNVHGIFFEDFSYILFVCRLINGIKRQTS